MIFVLWVHTEKSKENENNPEEKVNNPEEESKDLEEEGKAPEEEILYEAFEKPIENEIK